MQKVLQILKTSWLLRLTLLLCMGIMMSFSLSGQITFAPRVSYNWANYRQPECMNNKCTNSRGNLGIGLNLNRKIYKDLSIVSGINFYSNKVIYPNRITAEDDEEFKHFDFKIGIENSIFSDNTSVGIGLQLEYMFDLKDKINSRNEVITYPDQSYLGFELTTSHKINKVELFFDAFFNLNLSGETGIFFYYHTNFQFGLGYSLNSNLSND